MKIGFIGAGKMATAILNGILSSEYEKCNNIFISDKSIEALNKIQADTNVNVCPNNVDVVKNADIVIFAVKPFVLRNVLAEISSYTKKTQTFISIAAGISIETIENILKNVPVIRIMPNTPALVKCGISAICKGTFANDDNVKIAEDIFKSVGEVIRTEEKYIDIITAISGSGPAYYYYIINEMAKAGKMLGLDYETCLKLSAKTAQGSAEMIMKSGICPEQLIVNVTTPGGCTAVGNDILINNKVNDILYEVIDKTAQKAKALGKTN